MPKQPRQPISSSPSGVPPKSEEQLTREFFTRRLLVALHDFAMASKNKDRNGMSSQIYTMEMIAEELSSNHDNLLVNYEILHRVQTWMREKIRVTRSKSQFRDYYECKSALREVLLTDRANIDNRPL